MLVSIEANSAGITSCAPSSVASQGLLPSWMKRRMLPCTISAASITIPVENARPASEITFSVRPSMCRVITAKNSDSGMDKPITISARGPRRKYHRPQTARKMPMIRLSSTKLIARLT